MSYIVIKTVKGRRYRYLQTSWREGKRVRTKSVCLGPVGADMQRNVELLRELSWFDIPIVYDDGHQAIIAVEKGASGVL
jgi:hypothetical protein